MPNNIYDRDCHSCQQLEAEISELRAQNQILREELAQYQHVASRGDDFHGITGTRGQNLTPAT